MKYNPIHYAKALEKSLKAHPHKKDELLRNFVRVVYKNGDSRILPKIIESLKTILIKKDGGRRIKIEFARELPKNLEKKIIDNFSSRDWIETSLNPSLIAGTRITLDKELELDNSLARKLKRIFH